MPTMLIFKEPGKHKHYKSKDRTRIRKERVKDLEGQ